MGTVKTKKSKKKLLIILGVILVVIAGLFAACSAMVSSAKKQMEAALNSMQTDVVTVRELTKSIGATGTVVSIRSKDVAATLSGVEIAEIPVEVGDTVEEGQLLVQFDTEDIADNLAIAQRALSQTQGQYSISAQNAQRQVEDAVRGADYQAEAAYNNMNSAYTAYVNAYEDLEDLEEAEDDAWDAWMEAEENYEILLDTLRELEQTQEPEEAPEEITSYEQLLEQIMELLEKLNVYFSGNVSDPTTVKAQAQAAIAQTEAAYKQAKSAREKMENSIDQLYDSYEMSVSTYENTVASGQSTVSSAQAAQQSAQLSVNTDQQEKQIDSLNEQLEKGAVTAPFAGVVTAVNYDPGDTYLQGALVTVQDCSQFEIKAQIGEYDISDIALGQKVIIKTDATREQELSGTVVFVSPTATAPVAAMTGMSTVSTDPTYEVRISVDTPTDRLRLDMSANLSIIIQEQKAALTVPYNAVQTAEDGSTFVEVVAEDDTTTEVPVEVILESNYYTQIKGEIEEGQTVRVISSDATDIFAEMMEMSPMGGGF